MIGFAARLRAAHPVERDTDGRLRHGAVCLNDPAAATNFLGVLCAGRAVEEIVKTG
jgi:hypothetical protein